MKKYKIKYLNNNSAHTIITKLDGIDKNNLPKNIVSIEPIEFSINDLFKKRVKRKELSFLFYELNLMLQSNITFNDSLNILIKNKKDKTILEFLKKVQIAFSNSKPIDELLKEFKIDYIIVSFLKLSQDSGSIKANINALSKLLIQSDEIKKTFSKSMSYPIILLVSFLFSMISIFYFVIPKFKVIFTQFDSQLPFATRSLLFVENIFQNYLHFIFLIFFAIIVLIIYFYKSNEDFSFFIHKALVSKVPIMKDVFLNMEMYKFFYVIKIMLDSNYEFHKALTSAKLLINNKYVLDRIRLIENLLYNGKNINESFSKSILVDDIILNLINTGEISNSLPITISEISKIYKDRFDNKVNKLINLIQPIFLVLIMALILWIVLAIFVPIWDMGNMIKM